MQHLTLSGGQRAMTGWTKGLVVRPGMMKAEKNMIKDKRGHCSVSLKCQALCVAFILNFVILIKIWLAGVTVRLGKVNFPKLTELVVKLKIF